VFTDVGGMRSRNLILANTRAFAALGEETQVAVRAAAERAEARGWTMARASEIEMATRLRERGVVISEPPAPLLAQLREIGAQQTREWLLRAGGEGEQMLRRYREALP